MAATTNTKNTSTDPSYATLLGQMYRHFVLDCISDLGYAVSQDFSRRPGVYQEVGELSAGLMGDLQSMIDSVRYLPGTATRAMLYKPIFGTSDAMGTGNDGSSYQAWRLKLIASAVATAENATTVGQVMHRDRVRSSLVPLRDYLLGLEGRSVTESYLRTKKIFEISMKILTDPAVRVVFGINKAADPEFSNSEAAKLVEKISQQLQEWIPSGPMSSAQYSGLIEMQENGVAAIELILDLKVKDDNERLDALISKLYAWGSDLGLVGVA